MYEPLTWQQTAAWQEAGWEWREIGPSEVDVHARWEWKPQREGEEKREEEEEEKTKTYQ